LGDRDGIGWQAAGFASGTRVEPTRTGAAPLSRAAPGEQRSYIGTAMWADHVRLTGKVFIGLSRLRFRLRNRIGLHMTGSIATVT